jgi:hypothetical protein
LVSMATQPCFPHGLESWLGQSPELSRWWLAGAHHNLTFQFLCRESQLVGGEQSWRSFFEGYASSKCTIIDSWWLSGYHFWCADPKTNHCQLIKYPCRLCEIIIWLMCMYICKYIYIL